MDQWTCVCSPGIDSDYESWADNGIKQEQTASYGVQRQLAIEENKLKFESCITKIQMNKWS